MLVSFVLDAFINEMEHEKEKKEAEAEERRFVQSAETDSAQPFAIINPHAVNEAHIQGTVPT